MVNGYLAAVINTRGHYYKNTSPYDAFQTRDTAPLTIILWEKLSKIVINSSDLICVYNQGRFHDQFHECEDSQVNSQQPCGIDSVALSQPPLPAPPPPSP